VRSVVGRFLEHTRVFYFYADGAQHIYLSSADWMDRNFFRRIELCFPVLEPKLKRRILKEGLMPYLATTARRGKWMRKASTAASHRRHLIHLVCRCVVTHRLEKQDYEPIKPSRPDNSALSPPLKVSLRDTAAASCHSVKDGRILAGHQAEQYD
jgi:hypothetical protein